jgi:hypothetical protein
VPAIQLAASRPGPSSLALAGPARSSSWARSQATRLRIARASSDSLRHRGVEHAHADIAGRTRGGGSRRRRAGREGKLSTSCPRSSGRALGRDLHRRDKATSTTTTLGGTEPPAGGLLLADNVYLRPARDSAEAEAMRRFHEEAPPRSTVCLPTPTASRWGSEVRITRALLFAIGFLA